MYDKTSPLLAHVEDERIVVLILPLQSHEHAFAEYMFVR